MYQPGGLPRRPFLGLRISGPWRSQRAGGAAALHVSAVLEGGAAERAGLKPGDGLVALNDIPLGDPMHVVDVTRTLARTPHIVFDFFRGDRRLAREALAPPLPVEKLTGSIELGSVTAGGHRLRTITALPEGCGRHPAVLCLQSVRPDTCEFPLDPDHPTARLVADWTAAGMVVQRVERSGVGDSEGPPPSRTDLGAELDGYHAAFDAVAARSDVDPSRVFLFGQSFGGMIAPLLGLETSTAGIIVFGTSSARWHDCVVAAAERQRQTRARSEAIDRGHVRWLELHELVCRRGWTPDLAFARCPHLRALRSRDCVGETLFGRHVVLFQQLDAIDLASVWHALGESGCPILALHGQRDEICSAQDAGRIARCAGADATHLELAEIGHDLRVDPEARTTSTAPGRRRWEGSVVRASVDWMRTLEARPRPQTVTSSPSGKTHP
jgi:pimeloyl-ACP methyl ester carboxylesterase